MAPDWSHIAKALPELIKKHEPDYLRFVREQFGIIIHPHQTHDLHKKVFEACQQLNCGPLEYLKWLRDQKPNSSVLEHFIASITVGETYFFRDKHQIELLKNTILPELIARKRQQNQLSLRIWSAGCASGEEIYTIAILLRELLPDFNRWNLHLMGTDINTSSLKKAMAACYSEWSMRALDDNYKKRYFTDDHHRYRLDPSLKEKVKFTYLNLKDNTFPSIVNDTNAEDLILCRNVLIYFDHETVSSLMKRLSACLVEEGYLLLGASDPVDIKDTSLTFHFHTGTLFTRNTRVLPEQKPKQKPIKAKKTVMKPVRPLEIKRSGPPSFSNELDLAFSEGHWQRVLDLIDQNKEAPRPTALIMNYKAIAYANLGQLDQALKACQDCLAIDPMNSNIHFTLAMTLLELNQLQAAEMALRKALFLDHQFVMAHYELGLLLLRNKQSMAGLKSLRNALMIAERKKGDQSVQGTQGLSFKRLAEILKHELEIHEVGEDAKKQNV